MLQKTHVADLGGIEENSEVVIAGWIYTVASLGGLVFARIRDQTGIVQVVFKPNILPSAEFESVKDLRRETSVIIKGKVRKDKRAPGGIEILASGVKILGRSSDFPIKKGISPKRLGDYRHLYLRSRKMTQIMKVRSELLRCLRGWFEEHGYKEVSCPSIITAAVEGGATLFELKYFNKKAYLTQSSQLYLEAAIFSLEKVFTLQPSFRAEPSKTPRHMTEYWHLEMEEAWINLEDLMKIEEMMLVDVTNELMKRIPSDIAALNPNFKPFELPFVRLKYAEALDLLKGKGIELEWGKDLGADEEKILTSIFDEPIFISHFPRETRAFYHKPDPSDQRTVLSQDLLMRNAGEVIGGGERISDYNELLSRIEEYGYDPNDYSWYLDLRKYGSVPHAGFGLGVERLLGHILNLPNIRLAIPFPRTRTRMFP